MRVHNEHAHGAVWRLEAHPTKSVLAGDHVETFRPKLVGRSCSDGIHPLQIDP